MRKRLLKWLFGDNAWAAAVLPRTYHDKDEIIRRVLFEALVRYVEDEDDLRIGRDREYYSVELQSNFMTLEEIDARIAWRQPLYEAYIYIKETRAEFARRVLHAKIESDPDWAISITRVEELDQQTMETIVKYSGYMWT
jgi:hypothetical protein